MRRLPTYTDGRGVQFDEDYYTYSFVPNPTSPESGLSGSIAPGASAIATINIEQDSWFEWHYTTFNVSNAAQDTNNSYSGATGGSPNLSWQITDTGAGRNLFNEMLPVGMVSGSAAFPYVLPYPRRFKPTSTIIATLLNYDTTITMNRIQINMIGRKLYRRAGQPDLQRFHSWRDPETGKLFAEDYFVYHWSFGSSAPGVNLKTTQLIEADWTSRRG